LGEIRETKFYYPGDTEVSTEPNISNLININKIGLPLLKRDYLNSNLLFEDKTQFGSFPSTTAAPYFLPQYSLSKKNIHSFEQRAGFKYDNKGNVIELTKDNGVNTVYIWGYNSSKLIAQIDNVNYATIQSLIPNLQTISNTGTESQLLTALATFRGDSNLANSFVTTYTYTTSLNISTITDPNGKKNTYTYDDYNRLQFIKDNNGKIVLENETKYQFEN
jgi:YD repeat-containing protein